MKHDNPYQFAISSPNAMLQFLVDYQYDNLLPRAIGANIVNSNVGEENLYNALLAVAKASPKTFKVLLDFPLTELDSNTPAENQAVMQLKARIEASPQAKNQLPAYCDADYPASMITAYVQEQIDAGACTQGADGWWNSDTTNAAINAFGAIFGTVFTWLGGSGSGSGGGGEGDGEETPAPGTEPTDYMPWIFGGVALAIIFTVGIILYVKAKNS